MHKRHCAGISGIKYITQSDNPGVKFVQWTKISRPVGRRIFIRLAWECFFLIESSCFISIWLTCFPISFEGVGTKLPSSVSWRIQASAWHVLDSCRWGGEEGRRARRHGQTAQPPDSPTSIHGTQLQRSRWIKSCLNWTKNMIGIYRYMSHAGRTTVLS